MVHCTNPHLLQIGEALNICIHCATMHPTWADNSVRSGTGCRGCGTMTSSTVPNADIASAVRSADPSLLRRQRLSILARTEDPDSGRRLQRKAWLASVGAVPVTAQTYAVWLHTWTQAPTGAPLRDYTTPFPTEQYSNHIAEAYPHAVEFWMPTLPFRPDEAPKFYGANSFDLLLLPPVTRTALGDGDNLTAPRRYGHGKSYALVRLGRHLAALTTEHTTVNSYPDVEELIANRRTINRLLKTWTGDSIPVVAA